VTHLLLLESHTPAHVPAGFSDAQPFLDPPPVLAPWLSLSVPAPSAPDFDPALLQDADAVVFTGSGVSWGVDDPRATPIAKAMSAAFERGLPVWGSCNGM